MYSTQTESTSCAQHLASVLRKRAEKARLSANHYSVHNPWQSLLRSVRPSLLQQPRLPRSRQRAGNTLPMLVVHPIHGAYMKYKKKARARSARSRDTFFGSVHDLLGQNQVPYHYGDENLMKKSHASCRGRQAHGGRTAHTTRSSMPVHVLPRPRARARCSGNSSSRTGRQGVAAIRSCAGVRGRRSGGSCPGCARHLHVGGACFALPRRRNNSAGTVKNAGRSCAR